PATKNAPIRYQTRYTGSVHPNAPPKNSVPALIPYQRSPIPHTSWKLCLRCHHWSSTIAAKTKLSTEDPSGSTTFSTLTVAPPSKAIPPSTPAPRRETNPRPARGPRAPPAQRSARPRCHGHVRRHDETRPPPRPPNAS